MGDDAFEDLPLDKWRWHPSPLAGQVVYVLTRSPQGVVNMAPKSWVTMAGFSGPVVGFGCSTTHHTCANAVSTGAFTLSFPDAAQAQSAAAVSQAPRDQRLGVTGLTLGDPSPGAVAHLRECPAFCECELYRVVELEEQEVFIFGRITRIAVRSGLTAQGARQAYRELAPAFFLEPRVMAGLGPLIEEEPSP
ncbi:MAG: flavin reductase [Actinomycetia bacterium]|nr:flavin reductase [Actinomycetes bacterium]